MPEEHFEHEVHEASPVAGVLESWVAPKSVEFWVAP